MDMHRKNSVSWFGNIAVLIIVIVFFVISCSGFMMGDDYWMKNNVSSLFDLIKYTGAFYFYSPPVPERSPSEKVPPGR